MLKRLTTDLARRLLSLDAEAVQVLETQNQRVEDRRADRVVRMRGTDGEKFLLHIEIANNNKADAALLHGHPLCRPSWTYPTIPDPHRNRPPHHAAES